MSLSGPSVTASFQYDVLGRRKSKTVNSITTEFLYDGIEAVQELSGGAPTANLLTGVRIDEVLLRTDAAGGRSFLADGLGSTLALTDNTGTVQTEYTYEPFGKTTLGGAASTNAFQYTGRENDGTGLYYYRARYYHPKLQRFVSQDPIEFEGGEINLYAYVGDDLLNWIDSLGLGEVIPFPPGGRGTRPYWMKPPYPPGDPRRQPTPLGRYSPWSPPPRPFFPPEILPFIIPTPVLCEIPGVSFDFCPPPPNCS